MCPPPLIALAATAVSTGVGVLSARKAQKSQDRAQRENIAAQERTNANAQKAEANKRRMPNYGAIFDRNTIKSGVSATMLTGAGGVTSGLTLGRNSLLG